MRYEIIEEAGELEIKYEGPALDAYSLGVIQLNLHEMCEKEATNQLFGAGLLSWKSRFDLYGGPLLAVTHTGEPVVRLQITGIKSGSLNETFKLTVIGILGDPFARSVLSGVISNVITGIAGTPIKGITSRLRSRQEVHSSSRRRAVLDVGENIVSIAKTLSEHSDGQQVKFRLTHRVTGDETVDEVVWETTPTE